MNKIGWKKHSSHNSQLVYTKKSHNTTEDQGYQTVTTNSHMPEQKSTTPPTEMNSIDKH